MSTAPQSTEGASALPEVARLQAELQQERTARGHAETNATAAHAALLRLQAEFEQFLHVIAHDLQAPVRHIKAFSEILARRDDVAGPMTREMVDFIIEGATHLEILIQELVRYERIQTRNQPFVTVNCAALFDFVASQMRAAAEEAGAIISRDELPAVTGDPVQLEQVFRELLDNALLFRAADRPPRIHVSASCDGSLAPGDGGDLEAESSQGRNLWRFAVRDNGMGIQRQQREHIFEVFQRLHPRKDYPGEGMGLAVCRRIVQRHGGRIWVESEPGVGSTFFFTIQGCD